MMLPVVWGTFIIIVVAAVLDCRSGSGFGLLPLPSGEREFTKCAASSVDHS